MKDERIAILDIDKLDEDAERYPTKGHYLVHWFWTDGIGRERHEAGQYGDRGNGLSEIEEVFGKDQACRLRSLMPGQSTTWEGHYHGSWKQVFVNRID